MAHLQARTDHFLRFMAYPTMIRRNIRSTNLPEGINNLIETLRRNAGELCISVLARRKPLLE